MYTWFSPRNELYLQLTSPCIVHSNVYGPSDIHCIRYHTVVNSIHSTSPPVQKYHHITPGSVEVPLATTARNSSFIGEEPVPCGVTTMRRSATRSLVSHTAQGINTFTDVFQSHKTVVLVCCTSQPETDCTKEERSTTVTEDMMLCWCICSLSARPCNERTTTHHICFILTFKNVYFNTYIHVCYWSMCILCIGYNMWVCL